MIKITHDVTKETYLIVALQMYATTVSFICFVKLKPFLTTIKLTFYYFTERSYFQDFSRPNSKYKLIITYQKECYVFFIITQPFFANESIMIRTIIVIPQSQFSDINTIFIAVVIWLFAEPSFLNSYIGSIGPSKFTFIFQII